MASLPAFSVLTGGQVVLTSSPWYPLAVGRVLATKPNDHVPVPFSEWLRWHRDCLQLHPPEAQSQVDMYLALAGALQ